MANGSNLLNNPKETDMFTHTYINLRYGVLHSLDYVCRGGHRIHECFETLYYDDIVWC